MTSVESRSVKCAALTRHVLNAFTVDVEDYFQVTAFDRLVDRDQWNRIDGRVVANTQRILDQLARYNVRGTFFILGWIAERYPELVRAIRSAGHELGCHSFWHRLIYRQSRGEFRDDVRRAKSAIEDAGGQQVVAYRAPSFSITRSSWWALEILAAEGFQIDSSIFPAMHDRYGIPEANPRLHTIETQSGRIWEFPLAVKRWGRWNVPVSGGGYFRLFPFSFTRRCLASLNERGQPFAFYIHPWEVDPNQPQVPGASRLRHFRHYINLATTERKLMQLLDAFRFGTMSDVIANQDSVATLTSIPENACAAMAQG